MNSNTDISFVIPVFNGLEYTKELLSALNNTLNDCNFNYEILIGDNMSIDGTRDFLATIADPRVKVILNEKNLFYGGNVNNLVKIANGKILVILNNDLMLTPNWLEPMLDVYDKEERIGIITNIQLNPENQKICHAGLVFDPKGRPMHIRYNLKEFPTEEYSERRAVTGACTVINRELFLKFEGYDESFRNGFEDTDLCLRMTQDGYRHFVANRSRIYHHMERSADRTSYENENYSKYMKRWASITKNWDNEEWAIEYLKCRKSDWFKVSLKKILYALYLKYKNGLTRYVFKS